MKKGLPEERHPSETQHKNTPLHRRCSPRKKERAMARSFLRGEHLRCRGVFLCCVSDGCLSSGRPFFIRNVSPTAYVPSSFFFFMPPAGNFLSIAKESTQRTPLETDGFKTSFVECKSYFLNPAETGNWSASTHAAALLGG